MTVVPGVTTSLSTTPRGEKKASLSQEAQLTSYSDLLLLIKLSPIPEPHAASNAGSMKGSGGQLNCQKENPSRLGRRNRKRASHIHSAGWADPDHKASGFQHSCLPIRSFSDSLDTWSLSFYVSAPISTPQLRDKPRRILISVSPAPGRAWLRSAVREMRWPIGGVLGEGTITPTSTWKVMFLCCCIDGSAFSRRNGNTSLRRKSFLSYHISKDCVLNCKPALTFLTTS